MIKRILRAALGVIFFFTFLLLLLTGAVKFRILSASFWKTALDGGGVYQQLQSQVGKFGEGAESDLRKQAAEAGASAKAVQTFMTSGPFAPLFSLDELLTESRFRELIETNIDRLLGYLNGKDKELILFLPVKEWNLPVAAFGQPAMARFTAQTPVEDVFQILGMKPDQAKSSIDGLGQVKTVLGYLIVVWIVLLLLVVGVGVGHYFLGGGLGDRVGGTAWLLMISGFVAKLIGMGADNVFGFVAANSKPPMDPTIAALGRSLVGQFFSFGATFGLIVGVIGLAGIVGGIYLGKKEKSKVEKARIGLVKRLLAFVLGVGLGLLVLGGAVGLVVVSLGGKVDLKMGEGSVSIGSTGGETEVYKSDKGWSMKSPAGFETLKDETSEGFLKRPSQSSTNWAAIEVKETGRPKEVDEGTWLSAFQKAFDSGALGLKNAKLVQEPKEDVDRGMKRFDFVLDHDSVISGTSMRLRLWRVEFYPQSGGEGFAINTRVPVELWDKYEKIVREALGTFEIDK